MFISGVKRLLKDSKYAVEVGKKYGSSLEISWKSLGNIMETIRKLELLPKNCGNSMEAGNIMEMAWKFYGIKVEIVWNSEMEWK